MPGTLRYGQAQGNWASSASYAPIDIGRASGEPNAAIQRCEAQAAKNLDAWLTLLYTYYVEGGYACIVATHVVTVGIQLFTLLFLLVVTIPMNWSALVACTNEVTCQHIGAYLDWHRLKLPTFGSSMLLLYIAGGLAFCAWNAWVAVGEVWEVRDMQYFYQHVLEIPDDLLHAIEWSDVLEALKAAHFENRAQVVRVMHGLDWSGGVSQSAALSGTELATSMGLQASASSATGKAKSSARQQRHSFQGNDVVGTLMQAMGAFNQKRGPSSVPAQAQQPQPPDPASATIPAFGADRALLPEHYVVMRIMRQENYLIALRNQGLLDLKVACVVPVPGCCKAAWHMCCSSRQASAATPRHARGVRHAIAMDAYQTLDEPASPLRSRSDVLSHSAVSSSIEPIAAPAQQEPAPTVSGCTCSSHPRGVKVLYDVPWTSLLNLNLRRGLLGPMISGRFEMRHDWLASEQGFVSRLRSLAVQNAVLLPLVLPLVLVYQMMLHLQDVHARKDYMGPRKWSTAAQQWFRDYNELEHVLKRRLAAAMPLASKYLGMFRSQLAIIIARGVAYACGAIVTLLVVVAAVNDEALLHVSLGSFNLLWYTGLFTGILAVARSAVPPQEFAAANPAHPMSELAPLVRHLPQSWIDRPARPSTRAAMESLYPYRIQSLVDELIAALVLPYLLGSVLPGRAHIIADFLRQTTVRVKGLGDVCGHALFDMRQFSDAAAAAAGKSQLGAMRPSGPTRARAGKIESSLLSFHANYPTWSRNVVAADMDALAASGAGGQGGAGPEQAARHGAARGGGGCGLTASMLCAPLEDIPSDDELPSDVDSVHSGQEPADRVRRRRNQQLPAQRAGGLRSASFDAHPLGEYGARASSAPRALQDAVPSFRTEYQLARTFLSGRQAQAARQERGAAASTPNHPAYMQL